MGIERYAAGAQWDLDGPLKDALEIRCWLLSCGVPAQQIHLHVAPLEKNQATLVDLQCYIQKAEEQAIRETIQRIKNKSPQADDLLFLYWAGHGLISQDQQCLLLAEATDADMKSYGVDNGEGSLCASFANEHCPSFSQQIFLFDACRCFHRQPDCPLPVVPLPSGKRLQKSQFLFFACQEGQAAKNQGQKGCGRFTEVLLEQLHANQAPADCWPPDMDSIATAVQQRFKENEQQYPVYRRYRGFQGNEEIDLPPVDAMAQSASTAILADPGDLRAAVNNLAEMLSMHLGQPNKRDDILRDFYYCGALGSAITSRVERRTNSLDDYKSIIYACVDSEGLDLLKNVTLTLLGTNRAKESICRAFQSLAHFTA